MELSLLLAEQIVSLFLFVAAGYASVKAGLFKSGDSKVISNMVVYICSPCMVIYSFQIELTKDKVQGLLLAAGAAVLVHILLIVWTALLRRPLNLNSIERASLIYTNAGNLIIPLVAAVMGPEWVFYTNAYNIVQTVLIWTHGSRLIGQQTENWDYKKILMNPNIIAMAAGFFFFAARIHIPEVIGTCLEGFGDMIGTAGMFVIGMVIGNMDLKWVFSRKRPYFVCFIRLLAYPSVIVVIFSVIARMALHRDAKDILLVVFLASSAPAAAMVTQLAQIHNQDSKYASVINVMSIIFCIVTMPLMVMLYELIA